MHYPESELRRISILGNSVNKRFTDGCAWPLPRAFGGPEHLILVSVSSAGVCGAGVWDAQEEEDPEHHSHG